MFLFFKTQKRHHTVSETSRVTLFFKVLITNAGPCGYFNSISEKHLRHSLFFKRNNCYRSTTLLFGLGQTIVQNFEPSMQLVLAVVAMTKKDCLRIFAASMRVISAMTENPL